MVNWLRKEVAANRREMEDDALVKHLQVTLPTINPLPTPTPPGPATSLREQTLRSLLRLIDSCITQLKAQGPSRTCNESKEEVYSTGALVGRRPSQGTRGPRSSTTTSCSTPSSQTTRSSLPSAPTFTAPTRCTIGLCHQFYHDQFYQFGPNNSVIGLISFVPITYHGTARHRTIEEMRCRGCGRGRGRGAFWSRPVRTGKQPVTQP